ncbi:MAG: hypothetical protein JW913_12485 [Chitinispirillaceae bacterium]|nr:hypothetical protein [Chitinispirillaceae bacterium]
MAMPIKETPVLEGEDAKRFILQVEKNKNKTVSKKDYEAAKNTFVKIMQKQP